MFLDTVETAAKQLEVELALGLSSQERTVRCKRTGKPAVYFKIDAESADDAFMCLKCGIDKLHTAGFSTRNVILIDDLVQNLQKWTQMWRNPKIDTEAMDHYFSQLDFVLCKKYLQDSYEKTIKNLDNTVAHLQSRDMRAGISFTNKDPKWGNPTGQAPIDPESQKQPYFADFVKLVKIFHQMKLDLNQITALESRTLPSEMVLNKTELATIQNLVAASVLNEVSPLLSTAQFAPTCDLQKCRYDRFKTYGSWSDSVKPNTYFSLCLKAPEVVAWYGFDHFAISPTMRVIYTISVGKRRNTTKVLKTIDIGPDQIQIEQSTISGVSHPVAVVRFDRPLILAANCWYSLSLELIKDPSLAKQTVQWTSVKGMGDANSLTTQVIKNATLGDKAPAISFASGRDDGTGSTAFMGLFSSFYIARPN